MSMHSWAADPADSADESAQSQTQGASEMTPMRPVLCVRSDVLNAREAALIQPAMSSASSVGAAARIRSRSVVRVSDT